MIAITGAAGFIGSYLCGYLNRLGYDQLILVDDFSRADKLANLEGKKLISKIERSEFLASAQSLNIKYIFHLGARTDTTEMNYGIHKTLNLDYTKDIWEFCTANNIPVVYASSAATYGNGEYGYTDSHDVVKDLQPLNPYGRSKNEFDIWALEQTATPPFWAGVKFFNVYGPNEYHKGRMASVIFHAYNQIKDTGSVKLFRSHNNNFKDGEQLRDFIFVDDVASICTWLMQEQPTSGLYNVGTGTARTFKDLVTAIFNTLQLPVNIQYVDTPLDIRDKYQYFTEANMNKLRGSGYDKSFNTLEQGISAYLSQFLNSNARF
ncbi:MAG: ADP-glyceromanno-heptose 6-epimerase [Sphingobacteriales bacterium]|nr:MAG: ADP-glyceromanno-heptose 6-epimerase [Sphingobacteriales bacterium]